ncbi:MAG: hypothetical protein EP343_10590 [Deltaproteobacteria bacterium]|nr:MAG: hypothetical protein EP343_10590 [Deltaproteobacteria bacterium]
MSDTAQVLQIRLDEWPTRGDIQEFLAQTDSHRKITEFLTLEYDAAVSLKVGDLDLLSGYPEAFFLPVHAFVRSLSRGVKEMDENGEATLPIYLQQYEVEEGNPAHKITLQRDDDKVRIGFEWGGESDPPDFLSFDNLVVNREQFRSTVIDFIDLYARKIMMLLSMRADWSGEEISSLFEEF